MRYWRDGRRRGCYKRVRGLYRLTRIGGVDAERLAGYRMEGEGYPAIYNIEADPREENNIVAWTARVVGPYIKVIGEYRKSLEKYPNPPAVSLVDFGK